MTIQDEVIKIHAKYGTTEKANYEIQKLFEEQNKELVEGINLYENYLKESPCAPDIYADQDQLEAWNKLQEWKARNK